jgi:hypothetical protein
VPIESPTSIDSSQPSGGTLCAAPPAERQIQEETGVSVPLPDGIALCADVHASEGCYLEIAVRGSRKPDKPTHGVVAL